MTQSIFYDAIRGFYIQLKAIVLLSATIEYMPVRGMSQIQIKILCCKRDYSIESLMTLVISKADLRFKRLYGLDKGKFF